MKDSTRSRRRRQPRRPRARKIDRHREQTMLWPPEDRPGPVFRQRQVRVKVQERGEVTAYGGLALAHDLVMRLEIDRDLNRSLPMLMLHLPYYESDHVLTHVYNLFVGGHCLEDIGHLQHSQAVQNLLGACRIPDPSTAGDFLRRFRPAELQAWQGAIDRARQKVWRQLPSRQRKVATIDLDSTIKEVYGECKQGAEFSYNGMWSYHPLLVTLAETNEPLRTINRPGNTASAEGAEDALSEVLPMVTQHFGEVFVRADSAFFKRAVIAECHAAGALFALAMDPVAVLKEHAESLPRKAWKPFETDPPRSAKSKRRPTKCRRKRTRHRRRIARRRGYQTLSTTGQWVSQFDYRLPRRGGDQDHGLAGRRFRVVVKRQRVETTQGQERLFTEYRYRFIITNIPRRRMSPAQVLRFAYGRCDQENAVEQLKNGIAALRMPTGDLLANHAFLMAGQLAWCRGRGCRCWRCPRPRSAGNGAGSGTRSFICRRRSRTARDGPWCTWLDPIGSWSTCSSPRNGSSASSSANRMSW